MTMAKKNTDDTKRRLSPPARTLEGRENQLIALAIDLAEEQLLNGTASAQVITHYLKLGTVKEKLEKEKLETENLLLKEKIENMKRENHSEEVYMKALQAMRRYSGYSEDD